MKPYFLHLFIESDNRKVTPGLAAVCYLMFCFVWPFLGGQLASHITGKGSRWYLLFLLIYFVSFSFYFYAA